MNQLQNKAGELCSTPVNYSLDISRNACLFFPIVHVCMYSGHFRACFFFLSIFVYMQVYEHACRRCQTLLIHWGMFSQSHPELACMASLCFLRLGLLAFPTAIRHLVRCGGGWLIWILVLTLARQTFYYCSALSQVPPPSTLLRQDLDMRSRKASHCPEICFTMQLSHPRTMLPASVPMIHLLSLFSFLLTMLEI